MLQLLPGKKHLDPDRGLVVSGFIVLPLGLTHTLAVRWESILLDKHHLACIRKHHYRIAGATDEYCRLLGISASLISRLKLSS